MMDGALDVIDRKDLRVPPGGPPRRAARSSSTLRSVALSVALLAGALAAIAPPWAVAASPMPLPKVVAVDIPWPRGGGPWQDQGQFRELARLDGQLVLVGRAPRGAYSGAGTMGLLQLRDGRSGALTAEHHSPEIEAFDLFAGAATGGSFVATGRDGRGARAYVGRLTSSPRPVLSVSAVALPSDVTFAGGQFAAIAPSGHWLILGMHGPYRNGEEILPLQTRLISGRRSLWLAARDLEREDGWCHPEAVGVAGEGFVVVGAIDPVHGSRPQGWIFGVDAALRVTFERRGCGPHYPSCRLLAVARGSRGGYEVAGWSRDAPVPGYFFARLSEAGEWLDAAPMSLPPGGAVEDCSIAAVDDAAGAAPGFAGTCLAVTREGQWLDYYPFWREASGLQRWDPPWRDQRYVWQALRDRDGAALLISVEIESPSKRRQQLLLRPAQLGQAWPQAN